MEQETTSIWKSSLMSGIYLGIALILTSVIFYATGNTFSQTAQYVGYPIMIIGIVLAQVGYKKVLGDTMTYGQALGVGVLTMVFASVLSGIYTYLLYEVIDPSLQEQMRLFTEEKIIQAFSNRLKLEEMGKYARHLSATKYSWKNSAELLKPIYEKMIQNK